MALTFHGELFGIFNWNVMHFPKVADEGPKRPTQAVRNKSLAAAA